MWTRWSNWAPVLRRSHGCCSTPESDTGAWNGWSPWTVLTYLAACAAELANSYPTLSVQGVVADFTSHLGQLVRSDQHMVNFIRITIGNFDAEDRASFLRDIATDQGPGDCFLVGTDLVKDTSRLLRAYDDDQGVTARFNLNALSVMNSQLDADFEVDAFRHRAWWDDSAKRIQMHLVATRDTGATVGAFDELRVKVREGKHLLTEYSTKFTRPHRSSRSWPRWDWQWWDRGQTRLVTSWSPWRVEPADRRTAQRFPGDRSM